MTSYQILMLGWVSWRYIASNVVGDLGVMAKTVILIAFKRSCMPGSGLPCWAHSFVECVVAKQSSHHDVAVALPMKQIV